MSVTEPVTMPCPHCGQPMISGDEIARELPGRRREIYEAVKAAGSAGLTTKQLIDQVYANPPATNSLSVIISRDINPVLKRRGLKITSKRGSPPAPYRLVALKEGK